MYLNLYRKFIISEKIINIEHSERMVKQCGIRRIFCDLIPRPFYSASDHNSNKNNFSFKVTNFMKWSVTLTWDFFFFETQIVMVISMRKWSIIWTLLSILRAVWSILKQFGAYSEQFGAYSEQFGAYSEQFGAYSEQLGAYSEQFGAYYE